MNQKAGNMNQAEKDFAEDLLRKVARGQLTRKQALALLEARDSTMPPGSEQDKGGQ